MPLVNWFILAGRIDSNAATLYDPLYTCKTCSFQHMNCPIDIDLKGEGGFLQRVGRVIECGGMEDALDLVLLYTAQQAAEVENLTAHEHDLPFIGSGKRCEFSGWPYRIEDNHAVAAFC